MTWRWVARPSPFDDESLTGLVNRLAIDNTFTGRTELLRTLDFTCAVRLGPTEIDALSRVLGIDAAQLRKIAPSLTPSRPALRLSLTRTRDEAVCTICLAQRAYSRQIWSHALATACPHHHVQLIDRCPRCDRTFKHGRPSAHTCECGVDLRTLVAVPATNFEWEFARLLIGLPPSEEGLRFLFESQPPDIDRFMLGLANYLCHTPLGARLAKQGKTPVPRSVEQARTRLVPAFSLLADWPNALSSRIDELLAATPVTATTGVAARLGPWYRFLFKQSVASAYTPFRVVAANCIARRHDGVLNARTRNVQSLMTVKKNWYSLLECQRELGVSTERLNAAIDRGWVTASVHEHAVGYRERFLALSEIERIRELKDSFVDERVAAGMLEVPTFVFRLMLEAGAIEKGPTEQTWTGSGVFDRHSVAAFGDRLKRRFGDERADLHRRSAPIYLRDLGLRRTTDRTKLVQAYREIASGNLLPIGWDGSAGIGGLAFDHAEVARHISSRALCGTTLTLQQVADLTDTHYDAVKGWVESGILVAQRPQGGVASPWVVDMEALVQFLMTFTPVAHHAKVLGSSSRGLLARLSEREVRAVNPNAERGPLLRLSDLVSTLGINAT
ncbi:TniQ family protein [Variovorax dokdonensis]|uniref:TniQ family protein n=1 Tax=Variovorax dokdonensis TaxID=344883 RepID=A0ABT7NFR5_9BURK|nr:TniQ family protein [Variovorax dokdonensis]MDM0046802.1 TniQ family protein [Variovorax dokdonensis]